MGEQKKTGEQPKDMFTDELITWSVLLVFGLILLVGLRPMLTPSLIKHSLHSALDREWRIRLVGATCFTPLVYWAFPPQAYPNPYLDGAGLLEPEPALTVLLTVAFFADLIAGVLVASIAGVFERSKLSQSVIKAALYMFTCMIAAGISNNYGDLPLMGAVEYYWFLYLVSAEMDSLVAKLPGGSPIKRQWVRLREVISRNTDRRFFENPIDHVRHNAQLKDEKSKEVPKETP